jgi:hypothetical protein
MRGWQRRIPILLALLLVFQGTILALNCPAFASASQHPVLDYSICISDPYQTRLVADDAEPAPERHQGSAHCFDCHSLPGGFAPVPPTVELRTAVGARLATVGVSLAAPHAIPSAYASRAPPILA